MNREKKKWIVAEMTVYKCPECDEIYENPIRRCVICGCDFEEVE